MEWSNEDTLVFLELYQAESVLWDPSNEKHKDRKKINEAWARIGEQMDRPTAELRKKKDSLMASFRSLLRKKKASIRSGASSEDVYSPVWFAYQYMEDFLAPLYNIHSETVVEDKNDDSVDQELVAIESFPIKQPHVPSGEPRSAEGVPSSSRRRRHQMPEHAECEATISEPLNNAVKEEEDECDLYGRLLARKLRKLHDLERLSFMHEIDGIFIRRIQESSEK